MLRLENSELAVDVLPPSGEGDARHHGFRYCRGGYVWQVTDKRAGPLLSGPEGPAPEPDPYNGHGLPEAFRPREFGTGRPLSLLGEEGLILGVGRVRETPAKKFELLEPASWTCEASAEARVFSTRQAYGPWDLHLTRTLRLQGRTLVSESRLANRGGEGFDLHWFAHPFFPLAGGRIRCRLPDTYGMADNPGFCFTADRQLTHQRVFEGVFDGHFEALSVDHTIPFAADLSHPLLETVRFEASFAPAMCPVWGNGFTWSIEPYLHRRLAASQETAWSLRYHFGPPLP